MTIVLATPTPPTSSATVPRPRSRPVKARLVAWRAASASEGRDTSTSLGAFGLAVAASTAWTASTAESSVRVYAVVGCPSKCRYVCAAGQPIKSPPDTGRSPR